MKKNLIVLAIFWGILLFIPACSNNTSTEQNLSESENLEPSQEELPQKEEILWGNSMSTVKENETSELTDESENKLYYQSIVFDCPSKICYQFNENGELDSVFMVAEFSNYDSDEIFSFRDKINSTITEKYGVAESSVISTDIGTAISGNGQNELLQGKAFLIDEWKTTKVSARLQLSPDKNNIIVSLRVENKP